MKNNITFSNIRTQYSILKKEIRGLSINQFYDIIIEKANENEHMNSEGIRYCSEHLWYTSQRPYYKIYPSVVNAFKETSCDVSVENIRMPHGCFAVQLAQDESSVMIQIENRMFIPKFFFVNDGIIFTSVNNDQYDDNYIPGNFGFLDNLESPEEIQECLLMAGYFQNENDIVSHSIKRAITINLVVQELDSDITMDMLYTFPIDDKIEKKITAISKEDFGFSQCLRIAFGVIFCSTGSHKVLDYDVLSKHLDAYRELNDDNKKGRMKYEAQAKKKGKYGWCIGRNGRELGLPNGIPNSQNKGDGSRQVSHSFIRGGHWRLQPYGSRRSKKRPIWISNTCVRPDLPPINGAA